MKRVFVCNPNFFTSRLSQFSWKWTKNYYWRIFYGIKGQWLDGVCLKTTFLFIKTKSNIFLLPVWLQGIVENWLSVTKNCLGSYYFFKQIFLFSRDVHFRKQKSSYDKKCFVRKKSSSFPSDHKLHAKLEMVY